MPAEWRVKMFQLGIDVGTSTVKLILINNGEICASWECAHHNRPSEVLTDGLNDIIASAIKSINADCINAERLAIGITGSDAAFLHDALSGSVFMEDIPAIVEGTLFIAPDAGSIIEIGSQGSRYIANIHEIPQFATNGHCAGGTGSFFEDQMSRLGLAIEDYSALADKAESIPRLSGRCAVFAKTDIIHRQQEGVSTPDILLGLCYAMIRNYKATIVRTLPISKPVAFCGGVTHNSGVIRAIRDVFDLGADELIVPPHASFAGAVGAALNASGAFTLEGIKDSCKMSHLHRVQTLEPLSRYALNPSAAACSSSLYVMDSSRCSLGIDIGSTSTDLVIISDSGELLDYQYLRTAGNPEAAVRNGLNSIRERFGEIKFTSVGVTGSGRERVGRMLGADSIIDEITAQAEGAVHCVPDADTVFEIGGQDSKYISIRNGNVTDFQMNKICAAGTGSFIEEQAARMGIPIGDFGTAALSSEAPVDLGERCTVFIETAIASACAEGAAQADIAAGLCYSVIRNYLHKVVGSKPVGSKIVLQGGVAYNPAVVAAFRAFYGDRITVNPYFGISGAFGVALLALKNIGNRESTFAGFDFSGKAMHIDTTNAEVRKNIEFYRQADKLLLDGYTGVRDPAKKTVGVPFVLMIHKFFPMANAFFTSLGFNVVLTHPTDEETIRLSQEYARGETCYPVKLIYGHMKQLIDQKVDYIFLPTIHTMKHEKSHVKHNYGCVYMQTAPESVGRAMGLDEKGITLLSPVFDLDFGKEAMAGAMVGLGRILGIPKPFCAKALLAGAMAVRKHSAAVEKQGKLLLDSLRPDDKVLVLVTRNYGVSDPVLNMGIPELLLERGHKVITLSHLPGHSLDISDEYPNLYWPFGQHIISGAKLIANHPNLYAVYLTNHGCGPDSVISHLFTQEMGDKPYLQIEVDEHFSKVGVITRIEAFLNSLSSHPAVKLPEGFDIANVNIRHADIASKADTASPLYIPDMGYYTEYLVRYFKAAGIEAIAAPATDNSTITLGRSHTRSKEYLPFAALLGSVMSVMQRAASPGTPDGCRYLLPQNQGADADGEYARVIYGILNENADNKSIQIVSPVIETIPETAYDFDMLTRAIMCGDIIYAAPSGARKKIAAILNNADNDTEVTDWDLTIREAHEIPDWGTIAHAASAVSTADITSYGSKRIAAVGTPLCLTVLDEGILDTLDNEGNIILRAPLTEYLYFLWMDSECDGCKKQLDNLSRHMNTIADELGSHNAFAGDIDMLKNIADRHLPHFAGGNGRYRYAKAIDIASRNMTSDGTKNGADAVLAMAPRYENTAIILDMRELGKNCPAPLYNIELDNDWDESAWSKLRSFLYYC